MWEKKFDFIKKKYDIRKYLCVRKLKIDFITNRKFGMLMESVTSSVNQKIKNKKLKHKNRIVRILC